MSDAYANFLAGKQPRTKTLGFKASWLPDYLFPFQAELTEWAIRQGRCALFEDCGLGKTPQQLVWAENVVRQTNGNVLVLSPLAVAQQTVREAAKFGIDAKRSKQGEVHRGITVTNYHRLHHFSPSSFSGVVCDECFPPDTWVDVLGLDNSVTSRYIKDVRPGDQILNASGVDRVKAVCQRRIRGACRIHVAGRVITCSENHLFFTMCGWRPAQNLQAGDYLMETKEAMRLVRTGVRSQVSGEQVFSFLQHLLLQSLEDFDTGDQSQGPYSGDTQEDFYRSYPLDEQWASGSGSSEGWTASVPRGYGHGHDQGAESVATAASRPMAGRFYDSLGGITCRRRAAWCYYLLQGRFGKHSIENRYRVGRGQSQQSQATIQGSDEGQNVGFARVERVEVLELGHPRLDRWRDAEGHVYFYDIQATRHPSFSVRGILVHNSSVLKHADSKTRKALTRFLREVDYRLLCTATPAPNDYMELGTSAEALGVMGRNQMLGMFFTNDGDTTSQWRLKGHAKKRFWQWVGTWARAIRKPSDLGYDDGKFQLPPLRVELHKVESKVHDGFFPRLATTLAQQRAEKRASLEDRCRRVAEILPVDRPGLVWVQLNREGDLLSAMIPGAVQVKGSDPDDQKEEYLNAFALGQIRVLVSKPSICSFGLNWQHCADISYFPSWSAEQYYQAIRRCWRFGQENPVTVNLVYSEAEAKVVNGMLQKESLSNEMYSGIIRNMAEVQQPRVAERNGHEETIEVPAWLRK